MATRDAAYIKQMNRSIIIQQIIEKGEVSRAELADITKLTRATISAQVADLLTEQIVIESATDQHAVGRKPIILSINPNLGYVLGIDLDTDSMTIAVSNHDGMIHSIKTIEIKSKDYKEVIRNLSNVIFEYQNKFPPSIHGITGIVVGIHGLVSLEEEVVFIPRLNWRSFHLKQDLETKFGIPVSIKNNAKLSTQAEKMYQRYDTKTVVGINLYSGVGAGIFVHDHLLLGEEGFAGEVGHMIIVPEGKPCDCGNKGCLEQYCSDAAVLKKLKQLKGYQVTFEDLKNGLDNNDEEVHKIVNEYLYYLSIGLNNLINSYNPGTIILNGDVVKLIPEAADRIKNHLKSNVIRRREIHISELGKKACVLGACALGIQQYFDVPSLNLTRHLNVARQL